MIDVYLNIYDIFTIYTSYYDVYIVLNPTESCFLPEGSQGKCSRSHLCRPVIVRAAILMHVKVHEQSL